MDRAWMPVFRGGSGKDVRLLRSRFTSSRFSLARAFAAVQASNSLGSDVQYCRSGGAQPPPRGGPTEPPSEGSFWLAAPNFFYTSFDSFPYPHNSFRETAICAEIRKFNTSNMADAKIR